MTLPLYSDNLGNVKGCCWAISNTTDLVCVLATAPFAAKHMEESYRVAPPSKPITSKQLAKSRTFYDGWPPSPSGLSDFQGAPAGDLHCDHAK